jgi:hypothetical protein
MQELVHSWFRAAGPQVRDWLQGSAEIVLSQKKTLAAGVELELSPCRTLFETSGGLKEILQGASRVIWACKKIMIHFIISRWF